MRMKSKRSGKGIKECVQVREAATRSSSHRDYRMMPKKTQCKTAPTLSQKQHYGRHTRVTPLARPRHHSDSITATRQYTQYMATLFSPLTALKFHHRITDRRTQTSSLTHTRTIILFCIRGKFSRKK